MRWLCHSDARQVSDLPSAVSLFLRGLRPFFAVIDRKVFLESALRQVGDLPRIGVAEPVRKLLVHLIVRSNVLETCRASEWPSQSLGSFTDLEESHPNDPGHEQLTTLAPNASINATINHEKYLSQINLLVACLFLCRTGAGPTLISLNIKRPELDRSRPRASCLP